MTKLLTITRPDDWHLHLRDGAALKAVLPDTARQFARAIVMPNLRPPVTTTELAVAYRQRILDALPEGANFEPLMTLYLTDNTTAEEIATAKASGIIHGVKLYPAGATTNSDSGVTSLDKCATALAAMEKLGVPLLVHAEVTDHDVDVFDRERVFIERNMVPLLKKYPTLKIVFEHITTKDAAAFVTSAPSNVAATITAHHLLMNRNDMFKGGIQPHHYCLPILKREEHRLALVQAATSGNAKFFLGTDSAPHAKHTKEAACGCAGMYTAHTAIELYAEAFEAANALDKLEGFASVYGADFYALPRNSAQITLAKETWIVPANLPFDQDVIVPLRAGQAVHWKLK
ncbi:MAG: dihydroorotase [Methylotenera sp.]|jgi:dihydroorotase|nr:dihydroorotase [Methylotenera sp.]HOY86426.1 dihydroorotase [Methylotenera sp.]HPH07548.1 dihydroorotase [Methylotenera sp.]HPM49211.1 dihydroorotase [Methylotenera sp.]HPV31239.1 dihydroorotase [Methylotenera sp.]